MFYKKLVLGILLGAFSFHSFGINNESGWHKVAVPLLGAGMAIGACFGFLSCRLLCSRPSSSPVNNRQTAVNKVAAQSVNGGNGPAASNSPSIGKARIVRLISAAYIQGGYEMLGAVRKKVAGGADLQDDKYWKITPQTNPNFDEVIKVAESWAKIHFSK